MSSENKKKSIPLGGKIIDKGGNEEVKKQSKTEEQPTTDIFDEQHGVNQEIEESPNSGGIIDIFTGDIVSEPPKAIDINNPFGEEGNERIRIEEERIRQEELERIRLEEERRRQEDVANEEVVLEIDPNRTYFFVFGTASAGKSTMVSSLGYYLKAFASGQVDSISSADKENQIIGDFILDEMMNDIKNGKFVKPTRNLTDHKLSSEINLKFRPDNFKKPPFPFCILEMAGEDLQKIKLRDFGKNGGILDERINTYLKHPDCSMVFICVVDVNDPSESEDYIDKFLNYTKKSGHETNPVLITINKWDLVADKYENGEAYLKENAPILYRKLHDPNRYFSYMPFSIGKKGAEKDYVYDPTDAKKLFDWMYEVSIGESLYDIKPASTIDKMLISLKSIFKK